MDLGISGKNALVTGGSRGLGRQTALSLAGEGVNVAICGRTLSTLDKTVAELEALGVKAIATEWKLSDSGDLSCFGVGSLSMSDGRQIAFGASNDCRLKYQTSHANDFMVISIAVGAAATSGYISIVEAGDIDNANRAPLATSPDPVLRIYSSDAAQAADYIEFTHNQTNGLITVGVGDLILTAGTNIQLGSDIDVSGQSIISISNGDIAIAP
ncbi:MAG: SDR family NAD(P)-dependent oxidoreductase, partial [Chloroflexi bacterium]|nr:SDR family NAD(P)-dependent oxidoreductase [Chloroflexota bacterium]